MGAPEPFQLVPSLTYLATVLGSPFELTLIWGGRFSKFFPQLPWLLSAATQEATQFGNLTGLVA